MLAQNEFTMRWSGVLVGSLGRHLSFPQSSPTRSGPWCQRAQLPGQLDFPVIVYGSLAGVLQSCTSQTRTRLSNAIIQASLQQHFVIQLSNITK